MGRPREVKANGNGQRATAGASLREGAAIPDGVLTYKTALRIDTVMAALEKAREGDPGPEVDRH